MRLILIIIGLLLTMPSIEGYVLYKPKWNRPVIDYYINPTSRWVAPNKALNAILSMADIWNNYSAIRLNYVGATTTNVIDKTKANGKSEVFFSNVAGGLNGELSAEVQRWWDNQLNVYEVDIVFYEKNYRYVTIGDTCSLQVYVENAIIHEFGHMLGLDHSPIASATMNARAAYCDLSLTSLDPDDIAGIEARYTINIPFPKNLRAK